MKNLWRSWGAGAALITLLTVAAYLPVLHAGFIWDDDAYVPANPLLSTPDGLKRIWLSPPTTTPAYFPMVNTTLRFEYALWGLNPTGYHIVNILLHVINALLVWTVLRGLAVPGSWLVAAIWAVHPVNVESVVWITELKNTQSTLFYLLALLAWMKFTDRETVRPWRYYALAMLLYGPALFSKTTASTLPAAMFLVLWLRREPIGWRRFVQIVPFLVYGVGTGLLSLWWEARLGNYAEALRYSYNSIGRLLIATHALWFYAAKLAWPTRLAFIYPRWEINPRDLLHYIWPINCVAVALLLWWRRHTIGRGPVAAVVFFVATLSPLLGFIPVYTFRFSFVADHYQYLASVGLIALAVGAGTTVFQRAGPQGRRLGTLAAIGVLLWLGVSTWGQAHVYENVETLWRDTIATNPCAMIAHNNLGLILYGRLQYRQAVECFDRALQIDPHSAEAHYNLGLVLMELAQYSKAAAHMQSALQSKPRFPKAENGLGSALLQLGRSDEAILHFQQALALDPDYLEAYNNLGKTLQASGRTAEAEARFRRAMQIRPTDFDAHENLGVLLLQQHRLDEALAEFREAARFKADDPEPHKNLADILAAQRRPQEAQQERGLAASLAEHLGDTHYHIAVTLQDSDDPEGAIKHFRKSIALRPTFAGAYLALSTVLARQNRFVEAVAVLRQGLQATPQDLPLRHELASLHARAPDANVHPSP